MRWLVAIAGALVGVCAVSVPASAQEPGCTGVAVRDGKVIESQTRGVADINGTGPLGPDTVFNIASVSKQFTAFAILLLEREGRLSLEDSVSRYVPELAHYAEPVKIRHLLWHTGGVREFYTVLTLSGRSSQDTVTQEDMLGAIARQRALSNPPGTHYFYSNSGYFLLATIVQRVSRKSMQEFLRENVFAPLGMRRTSLGPPSSADLATAYHVEGSKFMAMAVPWEQIGESGVHTTLHDLLRWDENFYDARVGGSAVIAKMTRAGSLDDGRPLQYASGLLLGSVRGLSVVEHSGFSSGFRAELLRFPQQHFSAIVLCNRDDVEPELEARSIAEKHLTTLMAPAARASLPSEMEVPGAVDVSQIPAGLYRNAASSAYLRLARGEGGERIEMGGSTAKLDPVSPTVRSAHLEGNSRYFTGYAATPGRSERLLARIYSAPQEYDRVAAWSPSNLTRHAGAYRSEELGVTYDLTAKDGSLQLRAGRDLIRLRPGTRNELEGTGSRTVRLPETGADRFWLSVPGASGLLFERVSDSARFEPVRKQIADLLATTATPSITVGVARDGQVLWEEAFGWADRERRIPATPRTSYLLASTSKPITATGLMALVETGKVDLDRPANDYLSDAKLIARVGAAAGATLRKLANHSAGLPKHFQYFFCDEPPSRPPMDVTIGRYGNLVMAPGEGYIYSNIGTALLGDVASRVSRKSFPAYMHDAVFGPLGMPDSYVYECGSRHANEAVRYDQVNRPLPPYVSDTPGAGDIFSSVHDLVRFGMFHLDGAVAGAKPILSRSSLESMHAPQTEVNLDRSYATGWHVRERSDGFRAVYHGGGLAGASAMLMLIPEQRIVLVVLINRFSRIDSRDLTREVTDGLARTLLPDWSLQEPESGRDSRRTASVDTLRGEWEGSLLADSREIALRLEISGSGAARVDFDGKGSQPLEEVLFRDGWLSGMFAGDVGTADANRYRPNSIELALKLRGDALEGGATVSSPAQRPHIEGMTMTLTHWVRLKRHAE